MNMWRASEQQWLNRSKMKENHLTARFWVQHPLSVSKLLLGFFYLDVVMILEKKT